MPTAIMENVLLFIVYGNVVLIREFDMEGSYGPEQIRPIRGNCAGDDG